MSGVRVFVPFPLKAVQLVEEIGIIDVNFVGINSDYGSCFEGITIGVACREEAERTHHISGATS